MIEKIKPDMTCVPYRKKLLYFVLTIPYFSVLIIVAFYLWSLNFVLSIIFILFYFLMCYFQTYCCAYQNCPYVGTICPAIAGIILASFLTKFIYSKKKIKKSKKLFEINATIASISWAGIIIFPLYWISKLNILLAAGYGISTIIYYIIFGLTICPVCAIRKTCPGGGLQRLIYKENKK